MKNISKHVSYKEGTHSNTAVRRGLDNIPNEDQLKCMYEVAENLFEPLRKWVGGPIKINSFFRGEPTNTAIGGSKYSQHMKGQAIDIDDTFGYKTNAEMYHYIKDNLEFDQMVWEFGSEYPDGNPNWVHISWVSHRPNRKQEVIAITENKKTKYIKGEGINEYLKNK
jgi:zinc D-Ala-D-Ala carboxypeptidase